MELAALFVYGTLRPGHLRWPMLERTAIDHEPASAPGTLYDTGHGWPAARFAELADDHGHGHGHIPGEVVRFAPGALAGLLPGLDEMEGIGPRPDGRSDPYVRAVVATSAGPAWAYHATSVGPGWSAIAAWDHQPEA